MSYKSYYRLAFSTEPGGVRQDARWIRGTLDEIKADLAAQLDGYGLYLLCWYGAQLTLDVHQQGTLVRSIDLHPAISISVEGYPPIAFDDAGAPTGHDFASEDPEDEGTLSYRMAFDELGDAATVTVDWDRLEIPPLAGDIATPGDGVPYGFSDKGS